MSIVYFKDRFVDEREALVPISTHALHYGTAAWEGIRAYGNGTETHIFRVREHYERLLRNAAWLQMTPRFGVDDLIALTVELLQRNNLYNDTYIRPIFYKSALGVGAHIQPGEEFAMYTHPWTPRPLPPKGMTAAISKWRRNSHVCVPAGAKIAGLYVNSALAIDETHRRGFDQTIMLTTWGDVAEGYGANLFAVFGNMLHTPPETADILPGITRDTLIQHINTTEDLTVAIEPLNPKRLPEADELFLCGTGLEIIPLISLDGKPIGKGTIGPITDRLARWYRDLVTGQIPDANGYRHRVTAP